VIKKKMGRYYLASLFLHFLLCGILILTPIFFHKESPKLVTVILDTDIKTVVGPSGNGESGGAQKMGTHKRAEKERKNPTKHEKTPHPFEKEVGDQMKESKEAEFDNSIPSNDSSEIAMIGNPLEKKGFSDILEGGSGIGSGKGIGSDGPGGAGGGRGLTGEGRRGSMDKGISGDSTEKKYLKEHFAYIREMIMANLTYPPIARRMGWQGEVILSFVITEKGNVQDLTFLKRSGHEVLDRNVVDTIKAIEPFPRPPCKVKIVIPISYRLR
jgi:protein TonB